MFDCVVVYGNNVFLFQNLIIIYQIFININ